MFEVLGWSKREGETQEADAGGRRRSQIAMPSSREGLVQYIRTNVRVISTNGHNMWPLRVKEGKMRQLHGLRS